MNQVYEQTLNEAFDKMTATKEDNVNVYNTARWQYNNFIRDSIGTRSLSQITTDDIINICVKLHYLGHDASSIANLCKILASCMEYDDFFNVQTENPAKEAIDRIRGLEDKMICNTDEQGLDNLNQAKESILRFCDRDRSPIWKAFFTLAFGTGLSYRYLCALRWKDIDLESRMITSENVMTYEDGKYVLVNEEHTAKIPMEDRLYDEILMYKYTLFNGKLEQIYPDEELGERYLFYTDRGLLLRIGNISSKLNNIIAEVNLQDYIDAYLEGRPPRIISAFRQKDIRNSFIVRMHELGYTSADISTMLHGKDVRYVEDVISRLAKKKLTQIYRR